MATTAAVPASLDAATFSNLRRGVALSFLAAAYVFYAWSWNTVDAALIWLRLPETLERR